MTYDRTYTYNRRVAKDVTIDLKWIEGLRKDFLTLMKNIPLIKNYKEADQVRDGVRTFSKNFDDIVFQSFLNNDLKYDESIPEGDRKWYDKNLRKTGWDFYIELRLPLGRPDNKYDPQSEEYIFSVFERERDKWATKVKSKASLFWKGLRGFLEYLGNKGRDQSYTVKTKDVEKVEMEGFKVTIVGYDPEHSDEYMERFKEGLRLFKKRAGQVLPWMVQHMLPIQLNAFVQLEKGGEYHGDHIDVALTGFSERANPNIVAHVIAHEMGHHCYKAHLSAADRKFWEAAISEDSEPLDVEKLLKIWPSGAWSHELLEKLKDVDPLMALQIDVISTGQGLSGGAKFDTKEDFEDLLANGHKFVTVKHPVTGYGGRNAEEAFCEAIGLLVGFGPSTVQPIVKHWLKMIIPSIKTASVLKYQDCKPFD